MLGGTTSSGGQEILVGVHKLFIFAELEDLLVGMFNLEIAILGGSLRIFDVESSQAGFPGSWSSGFVGLCKSGPSPT